MTSAALALLGAPRLFRASNPFDLDREIRRGFPAESLVRFKRDAGFSFEEIAALLDISAKTIERVIARRARLSHGASDRLYRVASILALAEHVLEARKEALAWLHAPQHGLGGRVPIELLATEAGSREVETLLERIEHGFLA